VCGQAAFVIPLIVTAFRASSAPLWRDDLPIVRALGLLPAGTEGRVTTVFVRQGHYALDPALVAASPPADVTIEAIGDLLDRPDVTG
jgi:hypothetical protein